MSNALAQDGSISVQNESTLPRGSNEDSPRQSPRHTPNTATSRAECLLAYEALTGRRPFQAGHANDYYRQHLSVEMPPLGGDAPPELDRVIGRALAKEPAGRHRDVMELASELRAVLRTQPREQLRSSAQQWGDRARPAALLWGRDALADLDRWAQRAPADGLSELACSFVAASQRRARRLTWFRRSLVVLIALAALGVMQVRSAMRTRMAEQVATESEVEQGRQALLHGESSDAVLHLERGYQRGERSPGVEFMLARALQPRMSELGRFTSSSGRMWSAMFAPDGKRILTTDDQSARMWDARTSQLLFTMPHHDIVYQAVFSPDGTRIITAGGDGVVRPSSSIRPRSSPSRREGTAPWSSSTSRPESLWRGWRGQPASCPRLTSIATRVASSAHLGTGPRACGRPRRRIDAGHRPSSGLSATPWIALAPDQRFVAISCRGHGTRVWDTERDELLAELPAVSTTDGDFYSAFPALTTNGDRAAIVQGNAVEILTVGSDGTARLWDAANGRPLQVSGGLGTGCTSPAKG